MRHTLRYAAPFLLMIGMTAGVALAADDPFIGKWQLDRAHSKYEAGTIPQNMTITMEAADEGGVHYRSDTTFENGRQALSDYTAKYDERLATVMGNGGALPPVSLKRIDANTVEAKYQRAFKTIATSTRVVSSDRSTMTITTVETTKEGKQITNVIVFHRLKDV